MKEVKEFHQQGMISVENLEHIQEMDLHDSDIGLQVADDGRIWLCINGMAFIRFKPVMKKLK